MIIYENSDLLKSDCMIRCHQVNCQGKMNAGLAKTGSNKILGNI